jgi:hypothetical protein
MTVLFIVNRLGNLRPNIELILILFEPVLRMYGTRKEKM